MKRKEILLPKFVHFLTAFTILLKAMIKLEHPQGYWPIIVLYFAASAYIVVITLLHERLHHRARLIEASVTAIECVMMAIAAVLAFKDGARWLPYGFALAAVGFAVATIVRLVVKDKHETRPLHP